MKNKKMKYIIEGVVLVVMVVGFFLVNNVIDKRKAANCAVKEQNGSDICVEKAEINGSRLEMSGWCMRPGVDTMEIRESTKLQVILMNKEDESEKIFLNTDIVTRPEMNEKYPDGLDHSYCGFKTSVKTSRLDLDEKNWEILIFHICYGGEEEEGLFGMRTGYSIINGELVGP